MLIQHFLRFLCDKERRSHIQPLEGHSIWFGEGNGTPLQYSTLAWKIPWTEEPGRLQSMGSLRVRHD